MVRTTLPSLVTVIRCVVLSTVEMLRAPVAIDRVRLRRRRQCAAQRVAARSWRIGRITQARGVPTAARDALIRTLGTLVR